MEVIFFGLEFGSIWCGSDYWVFFNCYWYGVNIFIDDKVGGYIKGEEVIVDGIFIKVIKNMLLFSIFMLKVFEFFDGFLWFFEKLFCNLV